MIVVIGHIKKSVIMVQVLLMDYYTAMLEQDCISGLVWVDPARSLKRFESKVVSSGRRDHSSLAPLVTCLTLLGLNPFSAFAKV